MWKDLSPQEKYARACFGQTDAALGWAAGYIEADGSITTARTGPSRGLTACIGVGSVDRSVLERLQAIFQGAGSIYVKTKANTRSGGVNHRQTCYNWQVTAKQARIVAKLILPYMVGRKREILLKNPKLWQRENGDGDNNRDALYNNSLNGDN